MSRNNELMIALETARSALTLIATPARPDGTFNRCRKACQVLAAETLLKVSTFTPQPKPERVPYAWEVQQGHRTFLVSAQDFTRSSYDTGSFKPLFDN